MEQETQQCNEMMKNSRRQEGGKCECLGQGYVSEWCQNNLLEVFQVAHIKENQQ